MEAQWDWTDFHRSFRQASPVPAIHVLFSVVLRSGVYPAVWGWALTSSLLKPGKPPGRTASLLGIRLSSHIAGWFEQILDRQMRWI